MYSMSLFFWTSTDLASYFFLHIVERGLCGFGNAFAVSRNLSCLEHSTAMPSNASFEGISIDVKGVCCFCSAQLPVAQVYTSEN